MFIGSCGRPDLVASLNRTPQEMAELMFDSLQNKMMTLPLDVQVDTQNTCTTTHMWFCVPCKYAHVSPPLQVFPAHGAGSPCGKNLSTALHSTIGKELATNPALQFSQEEVSE